MDSVLHGSIMRRGNKQSDELLATDDLLARFLVTKSSWRGRYRRVLSVTRAAIVTQHPDDLVITNIYSFLGDSDLDHVSIGGGSGGDQEIILNVRSDPKGKHKPVKFLCKQRAALLTVLYDALAAAHCRIARKVLGADTLLRAYSLSSAAGWQPVHLRLTAVALEQIDISTGAAEWKLELRHLGHPAIRLLQSSDSDPKGALPFLLYARPGWRVRVLATEKRDVAVKLLVTLAADKLGITAAVDTRIRMSAEEAAATASRVERERASEPGEVPLSDWEASVCQLSVNSSVSTSASASSGSPTGDRSAAGGEIGPPGAGQLVNRRLVITARSLLERCTDTYEVAERRQLSDVAAVIRFAGRPQWLGVEWTDEAPPSLYITPSRDDLLCAVLDAAQNVAKRPVPVLPEATPPGVPLRGGTLSGACASPSVVADHEVEAIAVAALVCAVRAALPALRRLRPFGSTPAARSSVAQSGTASEGRGGPLVAADGTEAERVSSTMPAGMAKEGDVIDVATTSQPVAAADSPAGISPPNPASPVGGNNTLTNLTKAAFQGGGTGGAEGGPRGGTAQGMLSHEEAIEQLYRRVHQFNGCIPYAGIAMGTRPDEALLPALFALLPLEQAVGITVPPPSRQESGRLVAVLQALQRLSTSRFASAEALVAPAAVKRIFGALSCGDADVAAESARLLMRLWAPAAGRTGQPPWQADVPLTSKGASGGGPVSIATDDNLTARVAKGVCLSTPGRAPQLVALLVGAHQAGSLVAVMAAVEAVAAVGCAPGSHSTEGFMLKALLTDVAAVGRPLFALFDHPAGRVMDGASLLMKAVAQGGAAAAGPLREAALSEGAMLHHLLIACTSQGSRAALSQDLVALWGEGSPASGRLLRRTFPPGLLRFLSTPQPQPQASSAPYLLAASSLPRRSTLGSQTIPTTTSGPSTTQPPGAAPTQSTLRQAGMYHVTSGAIHTMASGVGNPASGGSSVGSPRCSDTGSIAATSLDGSGSGRGGGHPQQARGQQRRGRPGNWGALWAAVSRDHHHAGLIWSETTRAELRLALQNEEAALKAARGRCADAAMQTPAWNHVEFEVEYASLEKHLNVGGVFLNLLLDGADEEAVQKLPAPLETFSALLQAFLTVADPALLVPGGKTTSSATAAALGRSPEADRLTVCRAMAAVYSEHAAEIGPIAVLDHFVALCDKTTSRPLRHTLLLLLQAALVPASAEAASDMLGRQQAASSAAVANCSSFVSAGGVGLAIDLIASAHESKERSKAPLSTNLISHSHAVADGREWCYFQQQATAGQLTDGDAQGEETVTQWGRRVGPVSKDEIRTLFGKDRINDRTLCWVPHMEEPAPLATLRELRWLAAAGPAKMEPFEQAGVALSLLASVAAARPAVDAAGAVVAPPPVAHRAIIAPSCLPHLIQAILTGEPALVGATAAVVTQVVRHSATMLPRLYTTGFFFFALAYCGSNLVEIAALLRIAHLEQAELVREGSGVAAASYLRPLLPESLIQVLQGSGPTAFATALVGDSDTPELIWTHRMRGQHLVPQMLQHLGSFPARLTENSHAVYVYAPCPPVSYPELDQEVWCHRYYLRNLCDTNRFPEWPIVDHVPFLQALLDMWRAELARKPLSMSEADAASVLGLPPPTADGGADFDDDALKAAYKSAARRYHPDKNPAGREQFVAVGAAFERLRAGASGREGTRASVVLLLLQAQCILFSRYPEVLAPFKYAGYGLLLRAVTLPENDGGEPPSPSSPSPSPSPAPGDTHFLAPSRAPQLQAAVELCWLTCVSSSLNGEELTRSGGVHTLGHLLMRCISVLPQDALPSAPGAAIATCCLRAFAGMAAFPLARTQLASNEVLVGDIVRVVQWERASAAIDAALQAIYQMAADTTLQRLMMRVQLIPYVMPLLFNYDASAERPEDVEEGAASRDTEQTMGPKFLGLAVVRTNMQEARNHHAELAARVLARMMTHEAAGLGIRALLTPQLAARLGVADSRPLLRDLNRNIATPTVIWSSQMQSEVLEALSAQRAAIRSPADDNNEGDAGGAADFRFASLQGELTVAGVYVRVFNSQPNFVLSDAQAFCKGLVIYVKQALESIPPRDARELSATRTHTIQALCALGHAVESHPRLAQLLASRPALAPLVAAVLLSCTRLHKEAAAAVHPVVTTEPPGTPQLAEEEEEEYTSEAASLSLSTLVRLTAHAGCVEALAEPRALLAALWTIHRPPSEAAAGLALRLLHSLAPTPAAAWAAAAQGGVVYLLTFILPIRPPDESSKDSMGTLQAAAAALLGRLAGQPLHGPRVMLLLDRLLPPGMAETVREGPGDDVIQALREPCETPERLWSPPLATALAEDLAHLASEARTAQANGELDWSLPDGWRRYNSSPDGKAEERVAGVYPRLLLCQPGFQLRDPRGTLQGLLHAYVAEAASQPQSADRAALLAAASCQLLRGSPTLGDYAVAQGYTDRMLMLLKGGLQHPARGEAASVESEIAETALGLLHQLVATESGAEAAARASPPLMTTLMPILKQTEQLPAIALALETLERALSTSNRFRDVLVEAALECGLVPALLLRLDWQQTSSGGTTAIGTRDGGHGAVGREVGREVGGGAAAEDRGASVSRVLVVSVLRLLAADGPSSPQVSSLLSDSAIWAAFSGQRHDLFLPPGGSPDGSGIAGLLQGGPAHTYALTAAGHGASSPSRLPPNSFTAAATELPAVIVPIAPPVASVVADHQGHDPEPQPAQQQQQPQQQRPYEQPEGRTVKADSAPFERVVSSKTGPSTPAAASKSTLQSPGGEATAQGTSGNMPSPSRLSDHHHQQQQQQYQQVAPENDSLAALQDDMCLRREEVMSPKHTSPDQKPAKSITRASPYVPSTPLPSTSAASFPSDGHPHNPLQERSTKEPPRPPTLSPTLSSTLSSGTPANEAAYDSSSLAASAPDVSKRDEPDKDYGPLGPLG